MLFKSATSRNIFSAVALGVVTTIGVAGTLVTISYDNIRTASLNEMRAAAQQAAAEIDAGLRDGHRMSPEWKRRSLRYAKAVRQPVRIPSR